METAIAAATLAGTAVQATYAWMGFNRDSFFMNVGWRQAQRYYEKNYGLSWITVARDDIKEIMGVAVHHAADYVSVASMAFSSTILGFSVASFSATAPGFVMFGFYASGCTALLFLLLAILLGMRAQHSIHENTTHLVTSDVRPQNPDEEQYDYMKQAHHVEKLGVPALFRFPGVKPEFDLTVSVDEPSSPDPKVIRKMPQDDVYNTAAAVETNANDLTPRERPSTAEYLQKMNPPERPPTAEYLEHLNSNTNAQYLQTVHTVLEYWEPQIRNSKLCMGLGIICAIQAYCYFSIGKTASHSEVRFVEILGCTVIGAFVIISSLIAISNDHPRERLFGIFLTVAGPVVSAIGISSDGMVQAISVPVCFFLHFFFWAFSSFLLLLYPTFPSEHVHAKHEAAGEPIVISLGGECTSKTDFWSNDVVKEIERKGLLKIRRAARLLKATTGTAT